jgi:hypothetical protein
MPREWVDGGERSSLKPMCGRATTRRVRLPNPLQPSPFISLYPGTISPHDPTSLVQRNETLLRCPQVALRIALQEVTALSERCVVAQQHSAGTFPTRLLPPCDQRSHRAIRCLLYGETRRRRDAWKIPTPPLAERAGGSRTALPLPGMRAKPLPEGPSHRMMQCLAYSETRRS